MAYTRDDYIKDLYIAEHSSDFSERSDAKFRAELFERGRTDVIEKGFNKFKDPTPISDYEEAIWGCLAVANAADELFSDISDRIHFVEFLKERFNGLDDFDENERSLIKQIRNDAANAYHVEKIMYSNPQGHFSELKKSRDDLVESLVPLMRKYKEDYYDKRASGGSSSGCGCVIALIISIIILVLFIQSCAA